MWPIPAHSEVGPVHAAPGPKLVDNPEDVASRKREPEVVIPLGAIVRGRRDGQPAPNQAEQLAAEVGDDRAAVSRIKRSLNLDQSPELARPQLECAIEPGDVPPADGVPQPERVADDEDRAPQRWLLGRDLDRLHRPRSNPQQGEPALGVAGNPVRPVAPARGTPAP